MIPDLTIQWIDARHQYFEASKIWLCAMLDGQIVGQASIRIQEREWAHVNDLFVLEQFRRKGVGRALVVDAERGVRNTIPRIVGMSAGIDKRNKPSRDLFQSLGYVHAFTWEGDVLLLSKLFRG